MLQEPTNEELTVPLINIRDAWGSTRHDEYTAWCNMYLKDLDKSEDCIYIRLTRDFGWSSAQKLIRSEYKDPLRLAQKETLELIGREKLGCKERLHYCNTKITILRKSILLYYF